MKILKLLESLSKKELEEFDTFLDSPFFNKSKDLQQYYRSALPSNKTLDYHLNKATLKKYSDAREWSKPKERQMNHSLVKLCKEFLTVSRLQSLPLLRDYLELEARLSKGLVSPNEMGRLIEHYNSSRIDIHTAPEYILLEYLHRRTILFSSPDDRKLSQIKELESLINDFVAIESANISLEKNNLELLGFSTETYSNESKRNSQYLKLLLDIKEMMMSGNTKLLGDITQRICNLKGKEFDKREYLFRSCINFVATLINKGDAKMYLELYKLYRAAISIIPSLVTPISYRNITVLACRAKQYDWALKFVEDFRNELPHENQITAYAYNKAVVQWHSKDYNGVIATLRNVEYEDIGYKLQTRAYLLTCYFELDEYDVLDSSIKAFKVFLRRKRNVSKARKDSYYGFLTVLDHLMKASERNDPKRIQKANEVLDSGPIAFQDWLREKIAETEAVIKK